MKFNSFDEITEKELEELYLYRVEAIEKLYSNLSNEKKICMIEAETKLFCEWAKLLNEDIKQWKWERKLIFFSILGGGYDEKTDTCKFGPYVFELPILRYDQRCVLELLGKVEAYDRNTSIYTLSKNAFREYISILKKYDKKICSKGFLAFGKWRKYNSGSKEDAKKLYTSLQGYETGWDVAESEDTAISWLCSGFLGHYNIYVFYTLDENDKYEIPKIFIYINKETRYIENIMGVDDSKGFDDEMNDVMNDAVEDFLDNEFPVPDEIHPIVRKNALEEFKDSRMIPYLIRKTNRNEELTKEEYMFLYESMYRNGGPVICKDRRIRKMLEENPIKNRDIAIEILSKGGYAYILMFVSQELQDDFEVVKLAVSSDGNTLKYASPRLREDAYLQQIANGESQIEQEIPFHGKTK